MKSHSLTGGFGRRLAAPVTALLVSAAYMSTASAAGVTQKMIDNDFNTVDDFVAYHMDPKGTRYSKLDRINRDNVQYMTPAWAFSFGDELQRGQESQPLIHDGVIYVTGSYSRLWALDARTGQLKWSYKHRLPKGISPCCDVVNRGAALYKDLVIFGTLDAQLVALDKESGRPVWREKIADYKAGYSYTAAPMIAGDKLITGVSGGEFGVVGRITARNPETGEMIWDRPVIANHEGTLPGGKKDVTKDRKGGTWEGETWKTGGGATWLGGTYDPELGLLYMGTGNPAPWNAYARPGDNLYTTSRLAIDIETGKIKWHYQTTPNDHWDFDGVNEVVLFDMEHKGKKVKAAGTADRNGFFYVLNRENGDLLNAFPFVDEVSWASGIDMKTGRPIETGNRPGNPAEMEGDKGESVVVRPSFLGGKNWNHVSYSHSTGLFYIPSNEWEMDIWNEPITYRRGSAFLGAGFTIRPVNENYVGVLRAVDPKNGKEVWRAENRTPLWSSVMTTAGGLVFYGTPEGFVKAVDDKTGKELWSFNTGSGVVGQPVTWEMDGEQYVSIVSGWGGAVPLWGGDIGPLVRDVSQGGMLWTFKLSKIAEKVAAKQQQTELAAQ